MEGIIHICTDDSLFAGSIKCSKSKCPVCCRETTSEGGYIGSRCDECKVVISPGEEWRGSIVKKRRERILKLNRRQMANLTGYSIHTIRKYEYVVCPMRYVELTERLVLEKWEKVGE